jgi:molybdopterin-guanine dinucleotide biosynthesis protein A
MRHAGFVLVGGRSARMGRDKALLAYRGAALVDHVARQVAAAAGSVALVGHPERYAHLPYSVIADEYPDSGPLGGIHAALGATPADWNLMVACDMPMVTASFLRDLLERAAGSGAHCLAVRSPSGLAEPLCAVYHRRCRESLAVWLDSGRRKAAGWLASQPVSWYSVPSGDRLRNVNTPGEWDEYIEEPHG